jgi:methionine-rich copper-binding protein CopC
MARARTLVIAAALLALLLGPAGTAGAHDVLIGTAPAQDATVERAPATVTLEFSDPPQALGTEVLVTGPEGTAVSTGAPELDGTTVGQPLDGGLPAGAYTVDWRATSADGHPLAGSFGFTVVQGAAMSAGDGTSAAPPATTSSFPVVWLAVAGIALGAGALVLRRLRRPA